MPHSFTYSGHPTSCAVALRNLRIIEEEDLVGRAERTGRVLAQSLEELRRLEHVGDVRSLGLLGGVELVRDRDSKAPFDLSSAAAGASLSARSMPGGITGRCRATSSPSRHRW
jgi:adenosylmethionine-8-amino-7-oxononanoate aminotransferase